MNEVNLQRGNNYSHKKINHMTSYMTEILWGKEIKHHDSCKEFTSSDINDKEYTKHIGFFLGYSINVGFFEGEGIGRFIIRLVKGLLDNVNDTSIIIAVTSHNYNTVNQAFRHILLTYPNRLNIKRFNNVELVNKRMPADVWIVPYIGMELALKLNKPTILCLHDLNYIHFDEIYNTNPSIYDNFTSLAKKMVKKSVKVVFNSEFTRNTEGIEFLKLPKEKTEVIKLTAPTEEYRSVNISDENRFRNKYRLKNKYIVFPSVIRLNKNHSRLIKAFLNFKQRDEGRKSNFLLVLTDRYYDRPNEKEITTILNKCKDKRARESIKFLGRLPWQDIPLLYKYALGTIVPTLFEGGFPWPILESLTMNTPVAMSRIDVVKESITNLNPFITFDPYSIEEIERAIKDLCINKNIVVEDQKNAIKPLLNRTWADVALEYEALIDNVINGLN